jgi:CRISPR system Cascade subunit CasA
MPLNLLVEPLIRADICGATQHLTLSGVCAAMMADRVTAFPALRPHQRAAWHMFLAQVGALALHAADRAAPPEDETSWTDLLRGLTNGRDEPWSLVVPDIAQSAFLQPPVPEGTVAPLKTVVTSPDALDVLIASKNHDLKAAVAQDAGPDDWVFALVSLQTMEGFLGAGNYGIARMNGGFSARAFLGLAPAGGIGAHLRRDILALLAGRERLLQDYRFYPDTGGHRLLWTLPWNGGTSLSLETLDPWFVEICRRVRFIPTATGFAVHTSGSTVARVDAKALKGNTGDFWTPVDQVEGKAFSLDSRGFNARVLCRIMFKENGKSVFKLPPALTLLPGEGETRLVARGLARGQGKTEGYHDRTTPVSRAMKRALADPSARERLGLIAEQQQKDIAQVQAALRLGCAVVATGGSGDKPDKAHYKLAAPFTTRFDQTAEATFFDALDQRSEQGEDARHAHLRDLIALAERLVGQAAETITCPAQHRWRARARAPRAFRGKLFEDRGSLAGLREALYAKETVDG